ncbi:MAG: SGNH/GDSL hydrolase family protein [Pseudomonadota bacterium]|nr:SGNH/GDSL hydrolase family protein [Pseudomonadota bacterium]
MATTTNVPSSNFEDLQRDVQDITKFSNDIGTYTNRSGKTIRPIPVVSDEIESNASIVSGEAIAALGSISSDLDSVSAAASEAINNDIPNAINSLGLQYPPITYTSGLTLDSYTKTYSYNGAIYVWGGALGTVTTGAFDEAEWSLVQKDLSGFAESYANTVDLESTAPTLDGQRAENRQRDNAQYALEPGGYTANLGDVVATNGRVFGLIYDGFTTPANLGYSVGYTDNEVPNPAIVKDFAFVDNLRQFNFHISGAATGEYAIPLTDSQFRIGEASRSIERPVGECKRVLHVGDSLTAYIASDGSYTEKVALRMMHEHGGMGEAGYFAAEPTSISAKQQFYGADINQSGFSYFSDGVLDYTDPLRNYSPDGKGAYISGADGARLYYWQFNSSDLVRYTKYKIYYLQQPSGGTFDIRNRGATLNPINTSGTISLQTAEFSFIDNGSPLNKDIRIENVTGNVVIYGVELIDEINTDGYSYDVAAISGGALFELMQLDFLSIRTLAASRNYDTVVINIGTNDSTQGRTTTQFVTDLTNYIARLKTELPDLSVCIITPNNMQFTNFTGSTRALYEDERRKFCRENDYMYIDLPSEIGNFNYCFFLGWMRDGTHPNTLGQDAIGLKVAEKLVKNKLSSKKPSEDTNYLTSIKPVATAAFHANGGTLTNLYSQGCSIVRASAGVYDVTLDYEMSNQYYTVAIENGAANRISGVTQKTDGSFRVIYSASSSGAAIDIASSSPISFTVLGTPRVR